MSSPPMLPTDAPPPPVDSATEATADIRPTGAPVEAVPSSADPSERPADPHRLAKTVETLPGPTRKRAHAALLIAGAVLEGSEQVTALICGQYLAHPGVALVTDLRVIIVNARAYAPDIDLVPLAEVRDVKGWAESNRATLRISTAHARFVIGDVRELDAAHAFAAAVRNHL